MRTVSPTLYGEAILIFTHADSIKYRQLRVNRRCCISVESFFAEAEAEFRGSTLLSENKTLRDAYSVKFPDAFDENVAFGGRDAEFILLTPTRISGWMFENDALSTNGIPPIPTVPFDVILPK